MTDVQTLIDRHEIDALRGEFTDAGTMLDLDRFAALFTEDGVWRIPEARIEFTGRADIRAGVERLQANWEYFVQNVHPGTIRIEGDTATGRSYVAELGRMRDGSSHRNHAIYHDRYRRTPDGWRFAERSYEVVYIETTPLVGDGRRPAEGARRE
ncbi:Ketosteroid isomerase homolog [Actinacidiphila yanglinensis]|uniref:Ketosteroid isomerase homolog n=1 Tax=Actinacidiphila yanglinensis TaxID=310779 RepID=A0A1H6DG54_9ACTN|nr:nuclear transport factor 2 family protein [Actinacidiphila yanglinensis]SEG83586.1 Ketosteroid isomerase homolog [Actinacidiphila yanglinensis]